MGCISCLAPGRPVKDLKRLNYDKWMIPFGTASGDRWWAAAAFCITLNTKRSLTGTIAIKPQILCFSFLWLHRHMRAATLLSSLGVINEHAAHSGREEWSNCYLYCLPRNAKIINYVELSFAETKIKEQRSSIKVFFFCKTRNDKGY